MRRQFELGADALLSNGVKCPERSERYREIERQSLTRPALRAEHHDVETWDEIVLHRGELAVRLHARCACGWGKRTTITGSDANSGGGSDDA